MDEKIIVMDETRKKTINIALITMSMFILLGIVFTVYFLTADKHVIKLSVVPEETKTILFETLHISPGECNEYTVSLNSKYDKEYRLILHFEDRQPTLTLKNYAYIRIEKDGEILCDVHLSEIFETEDIELTVNFSNGEKNDLRIVYYMPDEVGNEAQNAEEDFRLLVTATNE